jgi:hypothetical protein
MLKLKDSGLNFPTSVDDISYGAFEAYRNSDWPLFFALITGEDATKYSESLLIQYASQCGDILRICAELGGTPKQTVRIGQDVFRLPSDLFDESTRKFDWWSKQKDAIRQMAVYLIDDRALNADNLKRLEDRLNASPYIEVSQLLAFFLPKSNQLESLSNRFQTSQPAQNKRPQDLGMLQVGADGITFFSQWQKRLLTFSLS